MTALPATDFPAIGSELIFRDVKGSGAFGAGGDQAHRLWPVSSTQPSIRMGASMSNHSVYTSDTRSACGSSMPESAILPCFVQAEARAGARIINALESMLATTISACTWGNCSDR